jgi:hypothetical protein
MKPQISTVLFLFLTLPGVTLGQDSGEVEAVILDIQKSYHSDSTEFHFELKSVDSLILEKLYHAADSIANYPFDEIFGEGKRKIKKFLADSDELWRPGDYLTKENENLPERRFILGWTKGPLTVLFYWHGGVGTHII